MRAAGVVIEKTIDLDGIKKEILSGVAEGVEDAVQEGVIWIQEEVLDNQSYVGYEDFPDVTPATRTQKNKRGNNKVLIDTTNYLTSWMGEAKGLVGKIHCGKDGYFARLHEKWRIDRLFLKEHADTSFEIIEEGLRKHCIYLK